MKRASSGNGPSTTHCGLPIVMITRSRHSPPPSRSSGGDRPASPSTRETSDEAVLSGACQVLDAALGVNRDVRIGAVIVAQQQRGQPADTVARHLRPAAVGVEQPHRRAVGGRLVHDQAVGADPGMARRTSGCASESSGDLRSTSRPLDVEEVVAVGVCLGDYHGAIILRRTPADASRTAGPPTAAAH